jgi:hypothetical protein
VTHNAKLTGGAEAPSLLTAGLGGLLQEIEMNWMDAEELAVVVLGMDEETADIDAIEQAVYDKFDISMEQFQKVAEALMPFTIPAQVAISGEYFNGFVEDGAFICKQRVTPNAKLTARS